MGARLAATGSAARRCSPRRSSARTTTSARPCRWRSVRGEEGDGVLPRAARRRPDRLAAGPRRRRPRLRRPRRWPRRAGSGSTSTSPECRCATPTSSPSKDGLRVAGAGGRRRARQGGHRVLAICRKWETGGTAIGEVTDGPRPGLRRRCDRRRHAVGLLVDDCPLYDLEPAEPDGCHLRQRRAAARRRRAFRRAAGAARDPDDCLERWAFEQYDSIVQSRTVRRPEEADAAVLQLPDAGTSIAIAIDGNGRRVGCDPYANGERRGGPRVRAEPRLRRCGAARPDQLPQLRQSREADGRLAARPLDAGARRRL